MRHPFNAKVRLYFVYNNSKFKKVSVSLRKSKISLPERAAS